MTAQLIPPLVYKEWTNNALPLANGLVYSYAAGTTTPQPTYVDSSQTTQNTNPVILNERGEANIYLDPTLSYKFVVQDSAGNPIRTDDNVLGPVGPSQSIIPTVTNAYNLGSLAFTWANGYFGTNVYIAGVPAYQGIGGIIGSTGTTAAETAAGSTVYNFSYPPGLVDRYINGGNATPGSTDCTTAWNAAVAQAMVTGGAEVTYFGTTPYLLTAPINCTFTGSSNQYGLKIRQLTGVAPDGNPPSVGANHGVYAVHTGVAIFDCTGNNSVTFEDVVTHTSSTTFPKTGILWARNSIGNSSYNRLRGCKIVGYFSIACLYNYACEDNLVEGCYFGNYNTAAGGKTRVYTPNNSAYALTSPYTTIFSGSTSCTDHTSIGCQDFNNASTGTSDCIYIEGGVGGWRSYGGWAYALGGRALIYFDMSTGAPFNFTIDSLKGEYSNSSMQLYGIEFSNSAQTPTGITITNCYLPSLDYAIFCPGNSPTLDGALIAHIQEQSSLGMHFPGIVQNSTLLTNEMLLTIGTSTRNALIGDSSQWTISARSTDSWMDTGAVNKSFAPGVVTATNGWTAVGAITQTGNLLYTGSIAEFTIRISAATSIAWLTTATIALPFTAVQIGTASITDYTAGTTVGPALFSGATLTMTTAQTTSAHTFLITGRAFIA